MNSRKRHGDSKTEARVLARRFFSVSSQSEIWENNQALHLFANFYAIYWNEYWREQQVCRTGAFGILGDCCSQAE